MHFSIRTLPFLTLLALAFLSPQANAQPVLPGAADPGKFLKEVEPPAPRPYLEEAPKISGQTIVVPQTAPQGADDVKLVLRGIRFAGNTAFTDPELQQPASLLIGNTILLSQLFDLAAQITQKYQQAGYVLSKAYLPPQEIDNGIVTIRIAEGYVANVRTVGNFHPHPMIAAVIQRIQEERPLKSSTLEKYLLTLRDLAGLDARAVLEPASEKEEGAIGLLLDMNTLDKPVDFMVNLNNEGSRYIGPLQAMASMNIYDLFGSYGTTTVSILSALPQHDELKYVSLQETLPLAVPGMTFTANMSYSVSQPGYRLRDSELESRTLTGGLRLTQALVRARDRALYLDGLLDFKNIETTAIGIPIYNDRPRALRATLSYNGLDGGGYNDASVTLSKGLNMFGARRTGSAMLSRLEGRSDFVKFEGQVSRLQPVREHLSLYGALRGQYTNDPLLSPEEFGYGGSAFGRAYDSSEISGDKGVSLAVEARFPNNRRYGQLQGEPFVFYDLGKVWNLDTGGQKDSAASTGFGLRFSYDTDTTGNISFAVPLTKEPDAPDINYGMKPHITFSLTRRF